MKRKSYWKASFLHTFGGFITGSHRKYLGIKIPFAYRITLGHFFITWMWDGYRLKQWTKDVNTVIDPQWAAQQAAKEEAELERLMKPGLLEKGLSSTGKFLKHNYMEQFVCTKCGHKSSRAGSGGTCPVTRHNHVYIKDQMG